MDIEGQTDLGQWGGGGPLAVPRQWDFLDDGSITHRPAEEIVAAMNAPAPEGSRAPLEGAKTLVGQWDLAGGMGCLQLESERRHAPARRMAVGFQLEADVSLDAEDADFHLLINTAPDLLRGYQLSLRPRLDVADLRPIFKWDIDRVRKPCLGAAGGQAPDQAACLPPRLDPGGVHRRPRHAHPPPL